MTQVVIAPRIEDPGSDVEPILTSWWYRIRPSRTVSGAQWVIDEWPELRPVSSTPALLDPLSIAYELQLFTGDDLTKPRVHEFRLVPDSASVLAWQQLEQVAGPGSTPPVLSELEARVAALETTTPSGGASNVTEVSGISVFSRTYLDDTSAGAVRATISAAAATHAHAGEDIASGTVSAARLPSASATAVGVVELATNAEAVAGTDTARAVTPAALAAAIAALGTIVSVPAVTGLSLRLTYQTSNVNATRPTVPAGVSIMWEVPGTTEPTNIRWDLGDAWMSIT